MNDTPHETVRHATSVSWQGKGVLIQGPSGSGKSSLALDLMGRGAELVSDDRTVIQSGPSGLVLRAPLAIQGMIEARGIGILHAHAAPTAPLHLVVDLSKHETTRLPEHHTCDILGFKVPLLYSTGQPSFATALAHFLSFGRKA